MNNQIKDQQKYVDSLFSTNAADIVAAPDDVYREEKKQAAENGDTQAQAWVKQDESTNTLQKRIGEYDNEINRRQDPTKLLQLEDDYQTAITARADWLANNSKPKMVGKAEWQEKYDAFQTQVQSAKNRVDEWQEKSSQSALSVLQQRREQKFEELLKATGDRQKLGELPSEQLISAQAAQDAYTLMQNGEGKFSLSDRIAQRRSQQEGQGDQTEGGQGQVGSAQNRVGGPAWAAETLAKPSEEEKLLGELQHKFVYENNRWPKEKEMDALISAHKNAGQSQGQEQTQDQSQSASENMEMDYPRQKQRQTM